MTSSSTINVESIERLTGMVKWFNNKAGFGFITVCDGEHAGKDIFTHYSSIRVTNSQYKYLIHGEYVDFTLVATENSTHEYQAIDVCGVKGGAIMCETTRSAYQNTPRPQYSPRPPVMQRASSVQTSQYSPRSPRRQEQDSEGYTKVVRRVPRSVLTKDK
jgi:cold shock CspA family protein